MNKHLKAVVTEFRNKLEQLYGKRLVKLVLFGSQARAEASMQSDIDILVVLDGLVCPGDEITRTGLIVADLSMKFSEVVSCVFMNKDRFNSANGPFLRNIRREGITI